MSETGQEADFLLFIIQVAVERRNYKSAKTSINEHNATNSFLFSFADASV